MCAGGALTTFELLLMTRFLWMLVLLPALWACGGGTVQTRKAQTAEERARERKALKVAVMPTLDCLPFYVARENRLFDTLGVDVRLRYFSAQMDVDTALASGSVAVAVTDLVRYARLKKQGTALSLLSATGAYWQLLTNRNARIRALRQLDDKMVAMTRYSATDLLAGYAIDSVRLKDERVYRVQVNDVNLRLMMLLNNEMDAMLLPEPQATVARNYKHIVLMDSRKLGLNLGAVAMRSDKLDGPDDRRLALLVKAYNMACDTINKYGVAHFGPLMERYWHLKERMADSLPTNIRFTHAALPRQRDIDAAEKRLGQRR